MKYNLEDLKEGCIIDFKNGKYGIITHESPNKELYKNDELSCVYSDGEWDKISVILNRDFDLYESKYPMYSYINLLKNGLMSSIRYRNLVLYKKPIKQISKQEIAEIINLNIDEFNIVD